MLRVLSTSLIGFKLIPLEELISSTVNLVRTLSREVIGLRVEFTMVVWVSIHGFILPSKYLCYTQSSVLLSALLREASFLSE